MDTKISSIFSSCTFSFVAFAALAVTSLPNVRSWSVQNAVGQALECYIREGLDIPFKDLSQQSYLNAELYNIDILQETCSEVAAYQRAAVCVMRIVHQCVPSEIWDYFPSASNISSLMAKLCDNLNVVKYRCLKSALSRLYDCFENKLAAAFSLLQDSKFKDFYCYGFAAIAECELKEMLTCGCPMTYLFVQMSKLYLNPPACNPITVETPACHPEL